MALMTAAFLVLLCLISILLWTYARGAANDSYDLVLGGSARAILERITPGPDGPTVDMPPSAMEIAGIVPAARVVYSVFSPEGLVTGTPDLPLPDGFEPAVAPMFYDALHNGAPMRFVVQGREISTASGPFWVEVQVGQTTEARVAQQRDLFLTGMAGLALVSAIGLGFVWFAIRQALRPLAQIERDLQGRPPRDLSELAARPPLEIESLFDAINGFIARLRANRNMTEGFIADVAHQTRTSLSTLQGHLELAADARSEDDMRARLVRAERQSARTVRLTNQLLSHAMVLHRADGGGLHPVALTPLLRSLVSEMLRDTRIRDVTFTFDVDPFADKGDVVMGDEVVLREALRNLIENALRHGPPDNIIDIDLRAEGHDRIMIAISDAGPGIPEQDRERAQERFVSLSDRTAGSGLGLAIVQAVAEAHGAGFHLSTSQRGGLKAVLSFARVLSLVLLLALLPHPSMAQTVLRVASATDEVAIRPILDAFERENPDLHIEYTDMQTVPLYQAVLDGSMNPDLVISSAMDLQVDLVNRGMALHLDLPEAQSLPSWAAWREELFGFTFEPAVMIYNPTLIAESDLPRTHVDLTEFLRNHERSLQQRIGLYDLRQAGIGYLFATQDAEFGQDAAALNEVLGRAKARVYPTTNAMIDAVGRGELTMALNLIGSYAISADDPHVAVHLFWDYNLVMMRTGFVPKTAANPEQAARLLAYLISHRGQVLLARKTPLVPVLPLVTLNTPTLNRMRGYDGTFLPIRLGPQLLTYLDALKQKRFLSAWQSAIRP